MANPSISERIQRVRGVLQHSLPGADLKQYALPECPSIKLWLLDDAYDDRHIDSDLAEALSNDPPYWILCWASGHGLAAHILAGEVDVSGKSVMDFGAGCGVVAIAAAIAGASKVITCEIDPVARDVIQLNSELNGVQLQQVDCLASFDGEVDLVLAADVLYEAKNLVWLDDFLDKGREVVLADSRLKTLKHDRYQHFNTVITTSYPDYHEAKAQNEVKFYRASSTDGFNRLEPK